MKLITAIIRHFKLDDVRNALDADGITGLTVTEVKGIGQQRGHTEIYRSAEYDVHVVPVLKLDIAVRSDQVEAAIDAITESGRTGRIGDGKIFISDVTIQHFTLL